MSGVRGDSPNLHELGIHVAGKLFSLFDCDGTLTGQVLLVANQNDGHTGVHKRSLIKSFTLTAYLLYFARQVQ